ncbi:MAG: IS256 family transposase [Candidatus Zixiibacteriota bacterium]|nr:MAG: IS256 family transposase [candidate division Zixibacteria bacterium]
MLKSKKGVKPVVNLWFTEKDLRYRWADVKKVFWEEFESRLRLSAKRLLEESLKVEQQHLVGAGRYERSRRRRGYRNGYYTRQVVWKLGVLSDVLVPRCRSGVYRGTILQRYRRFGGEFDRYMLRLFTLGLATRRVERFFRDVFGVSGMSAQTVSAILKRVSGELHAFHHRPLSDTVRYLYLDGLYITIRGAFKRKYVLLVALAETADGHREIIDFRVATSEKAIYWQALLDDLYRRGLRGTQLRLVVTDGAAGLLDAVRTVYGFVPLQVCWVHRQRNLVGQLKRRGHRRAICAEVTAIFQAGDRTEAVRRLRAFQRKWQPKEPRAVRRFLKDIDLSLTFFAQPPDRRQQLGTNNIIERQLREIRRRIKLIDSFRDEQSCERIIFTQIQELNRKLKPNPQPQFTQ